MFRPLIRQALAKDVPRPLFRLSNGIASRQIHSGPLPYSGPPSYDTIARRLSSDVDPQAYFIRKRQHEAKDRGQFIDIHDIGGTDPKDYDVLITDIQHETLEKKIAEELGISYLSKATGSDAKKVIEVGDGYIHGLKFRAIVPLVVGNKCDARWVFFLLDSSAPLTYLSSQASKLLGTTGERRNPVKIGGYNHPAFTSPPDSHFSDINILGGDFCNANDVSVWYDYENSRVKLYFGGGWKLTRDLKL